MSSQSSPLCCSIETLDGSFYISESILKTKDYGHLYLIHTRCTKCNMFLRVQSHKPKDYNKYRLSADGRKLTVDEVVKMIEKSTPKLSWCDFGAHKRKRCRVQAVVKMPPTLEDLAVDGLISLATHQHKKQKL